MSAHCVGKLIWPTLVAGSLLLAAVKAESSSSSPTKLESSAVDVKGVRHRTSDYGEGRSPWDADMIKLVKPNYPAEYRARHIEGTGLFRVTLDVKTGTVSNVAVFKSTGSSGLDASAVRAIRQWRWRPERWKEIDVPVTFTMRLHKGHDGSAHQLEDRATAYYRKGDNDEAIKAVDQAIRLQPTAPILYIDRGSAFQAKGQSDKALADFNRAIQLNPTSARAYCDRAILEDELLRKPDKALVDYDQAIRLAPDFQRAYFDRGVHFFGQHEYSRAIADFSRAAQLTPSDLSPFAYRAYAYAKQGEHAHAFADATVAIKLKPTDMQLWRAVDFDLRAKAYRILGKPGLALRDLREAVRLLPNDSAANDNLGWFLATCPEDRFRNGTEAVSAAKKACNLRGWQTSGCVDTLAVAYAEAGDFDHAIKYEKQALNDSSRVPKEREEREKRLALFQQRKPFREDLSAHP